MNWRSAAVLILALSTPPPARAWNDFGHMTAAAVAYARLTPRARSESAHLLRLNPAWASWTRDVPADAQDRTAFLRAATWADAIKHSADHVNDGDRPAGPDAGRNIGYADPLQHRYWHFIDVPFSPDGTALPPVPTPNAATQIAAFRRVLQDRAADPLLKSYDLTWLLHLVADVHQPLHTVSRVTRRLPAGDAGGNRVPLCAPPCRRNLHEFWDQALSGQHSPGAAERLARRLPLPAPALVAVQDESAWIRESRRLAMQVVYRPVGTGSAPYRPDRAYTEHARRVARQRIALGGARLAQLLNRVFAQESARAAEPQPDGAGGAAQNLRTLTQTLPATLE